MALVFSVFLSACGASLNDQLAANIASGETTTNPSRSAVRESGSQLTTSSVPVPKIVKARHAPSPPSGAVGSATTFSNASTPGSTFYKIGPLDVIEVTVFKVPDLSKTVRVAGTGTVSLPLVGELPAAGRTAQELERDLVHRFGKKYLQNPQVNVHVKEYNSQRVTVDGAVRKPGVYPLTGGTTLLQTIAVAGGLGEAASSVVVVFRQVGGKKAAAKFDVSKIRSGDAKDPQLQAGDVVVVSDSTLKASMNSILKFLPLLGAFALL